MNYVEHPVGLVSPLGAHQAIRSLWEKGLPPGDKPGWPSLDRHYSVPEGFVTVVTGWPGSGKSEFVDALCVNLMHQGWRTAYYSPENQPLELHAAKLLEKLIGKPFGHGPTERMSLGDIDEVLVEVMATRFVFARVPEDGALTAAKILEVTEPWLFMEKFEKNKRALVIDPWNELEHARPKDVSETEYISRTLQYVRTWARTRKVHVFIVAHPQKLRRDPNSGKLPVPTLDTISGSQHWWNKADFGITVYRDPANVDGQDVEIHVQKVRFKHHGRPGLVVLRYDRITGRYHEIPPPLEVRRYANKGDDD